LLLTEREFATVPSLKLLDGAFQIAADYGRTIYDCLYVALAVQTESQLITADERLANSLASRFPIKWLGAL
jgi:predicted nucleic acid-binding protein